MGDDYNVQTLKDMQRWDFVWSTALNTPATLRKLLAMIREGKSIREIMGPGIHAVSRETGETVGEILGLEAEGDGAND